MKIKGKDFKGSFRKNEKLKGCLDAFDQKLRKKTKNLRKI